MPQGSQTPVYMVEGDVAPDEWAALPEGPEGPPGSPEPAPGTPYSITVTGAGAILQFWLALKTDLSGVPPPGVSTVEATDAMVAEGTLSDFLTGVGDTHETEIKVRNTGTAPGHYVFRFFF